MTQLTERRAADRLAMANAVETLALSLGAAVTRPERFVPRQVRLAIATPHGCEVSVDFDGDTTQPDVHVITWNVASNSLYAFSGALGDVNPHHFAKVNRVGYGLDDLLRILARDIPALLDGRGYSAERAAKRAADRLGRFRKSMAYIAPRVAAGEGIGDPAEAWSYESPEALRHQHDVRLPALIAALEQFVADGCPMADCHGFPWK